MSQSKKKLWTTPMLRHFRKPKELQSYYGNVVSGTEQEQLTEIIQRMRSSRENLHAD